MKIDLRYKNAPLFAVSIALSLSATSMAEAAPVVVKADNAKPPNNPDEAVRSMVGAQIGQVGVVQPIAILPRPSEIIPTARKNGSQPSVPVVTGMASTASQVTNTAVPANGSTNPLDRISTGITNKSSRQEIPQVQSIYIPPSPQAQSVAPPAPPVSRAAASNEVSEANAPAAGLPFPEVETKNIPVQEPSKVTRETFISQQSTADQAANSGGSWANLSGIGNLTNNLVSNSKKMVLSIRNDSSALLSMGSVRLEIPSAYTSRLILGSTINNSQLPALTSDSDSSVLSLIPRRGDTPAMRLLLTQKGPSEVSRLIVLGENQKSVAFTVIGAHRFSNKPNV